MQIRNVLPCRLRGPVAADLRRARCAPPTETSPPRHPFAGLGTVRSIKRVQVQGARQVDAETYELYVAGRHAKGNAADGPFSVDHPPWRRTPSHGTCCCLEVGSILALPDESPWSVGIPNLSSITAAVTGSEAAGNSLREDARSCRKARSSARGGPAGMRARCLSRRRVTRPQASCAPPGRQRRRTTEGKSPPLRARERVNSRVCTGLPV